MALTKYGIGGPITGVKDENSIEKREEVIPDSITEKASYIIICNKCQIQHMVLATEFSRKCFCGGTVKIGDLS